jgi:hypothetical protein
MVTQTQRISPRSRADSFVEDCTDPPKLAHPGDSDREANVKTSVYQRLSLHLPISPSLHEEIFGDRGASTDIAELRHRTPVTTTVAEGSLEDYLIWIQHK